MPKEVIIGDYRVLEPIASGAIGDTYKAQHLLIGEISCIKHCHLMSPDTERILYDEARAIWDLRHYALPAMRNVYKLPDGTVALVMSYIEGPTLKQLVEKVGPLDAEHVAWIFERLLNALSYLHDNGVLHGDIKPQNIIIQPGKHMAVLIDFGLSQIKPSVKDTSKGYTEIFSAPEQVSTKYPLLPETDLYCLGLSMLYALNGNLDLVIQRQIPTDVPEPLFHFLNSLMFRDVSRRTNWDKENLLEKIAKVRIESFGRRQSGMKPIPGYSITPQRRRRS
jgi:serine/threonine-protein kinase